MNDRGSNRGSHANRARYAGLFAWLAARPRGRWATARGRWFQAFLTAILALTGLSAWALALVQPWTGRGGDRGMVTATGGIDSQKMRSAADEIERWLSEPTAATPRPLRRNPFVDSTAGKASVMAAMSAEPLPAGGAAKHPGAQIGPTPAPAGDPSAHAAGDPSAHAAGAPAPLPVDPRAVLEAVKGLRLAVILIAPTGERWAVINGENYREGDAIAGLEIVEIQEGKVKLQRAGFTCLLRME
jgi:hypothetical protein